MAHGRPRITEDPPPRRTIGDEEQDDLVDHLLAEYRMTLREDRRSLFDRFTEADIVRQVVGVGSVGMRVYLVLLEGRTGADPLFLQAKQAGASVYEAYTQPSAHGNHGERVISGKRLVQTATDIFVGWGTLHGNDYYVRQFRDMKIIPSTDLIAPRLAEFATACGETLARAPAAAGPPPAPTPGPAPPSPSTPTSARARSSPRQWAGSPAPTPTRTSVTTPRWSARSHRAPSNPLRADSRHTAVVALLDLTLGCGEYDRTRALTDGRVRAEGVDLRYVTLDPEEVFFRMARHEEFDAAEFSLSSYVVTLCRGAPFIAIPVFPSKRFRHSCIYVNARAGIEAPADLIGRTVGIPEYQLTAIVWIRGMLAEHYGVPADSGRYRKIGRA